MILVSEESLVVSCQWDDLADFEYFSFQDLDGDEDLDLLTSTKNQEKYSKEQEKG